MLMMAGSKDTANPALPGIIQGNHAYRRTNFDAQAAFAVDWGAPHDMQFNQGTDAASYWISEITRLRYPFGVNPSTVPGNPVALTTLNIASGWLGDTARFAADNKTPTVTSPFTYIAPYASYTGDKSTASWMPNQDTAFVYRAMSSIDDPAKISTRTAAPYQDELKFVATDGQPLSFNSLGHWTDRSVNTLLTFNIDPRAFATGAGNRIVELDLYDGSTLLASNTTGPNAGALYQFTFTPTWMGAHGLVAIATDAFGNQTSSFTTLFAHGAVPVPEPASMTLLTVALMLLRRGRYESAR
jgi:hypothetical protein